MRGVQKLVLALALAALFAFGLSACGGSSNDSTSSPASTAPATSSGGQGSGGGDDRQQSGSGRQSSSGEEEDLGESDDSSSSSDEPSAEFIVPGGDNSVQTYGEEADSGEREEVEDIFVAYAEARAKNDRSTMCKDLSRTITVGMVKLSEQQPGLKAKGCVGVIKVFLGQAPASSRASTLNGPIASFRVKGDHGFILYHGTKGIDYFVPMVKEGGKWKVAALSPAEIER